MYLFLSLKDESHILRRTRFIETYKQSCLLWDSWRLYEAGSFHFSEPELLSVNNVLRTNSPATHKYPILKAPTYHESVSLILRIHFLWLMSNFLSFKAVTLSYPNSVCRPRTVHQASCWKHSPYLAIPTQLSTDSRCTHWDVHTKKSLQVPLNGMISSRVRL